MADGWRKCRNWHAGGQVAQHVRVPIYEESWYPFDAGSFGFDFAASERCYLSPSARYVIGIAVANLALWDQVAHGVEQWCAKHEHLQIGAKAE